MRGKMEFNHLTIRDTPQTLAWRLKVVRIWERSIKLADVESVISNTPQEDTIKTPQLKKTFDKSLQKPTKSSNKNAIKKISTFLRSKTSNIYWVLFRKHRLNKIELSSSIQNQTQSQILDIIYQNCLATINQAKKTFFSCTLVNYKQDQKPKQDQTIYQDYHKFKYHYHLFIVFTLLVILHFLAW